LHLSSTVITPEERSWFLEPPIEPQPTVSSQKLEDALLYLSDADLNQLVLHHPRNAAERAAYRRLHSRVFHAVDFAISLLYLALALFERPAVYSLPVAATFSVEAGCLVRMERM
jgi:hypothetical protein